MSLIEKKIAAIPGALLSRVVEFYRLRDEDINDDIAPSDPKAARRVGVWFESELQYWR